MDETTETALREWLRENLLVEVRPVAKYDAGHSVYVGLRFFGEDRSFSEEVVYIPEVAE